MVWEFRHSTVKIGKHCRTAFGNSIQNLVIHKNSTSMLGGHFSLMRAQIQLIHIYTKSNR